MAGNNAFVLMFAGGCGGLAESLAVQPLDMVKTRFQLSTTSTRNSNIGIWQTLRSIVNDGGVLSLYRGLLPEMTGMVPKTMVMYYTYEKSKGILTNFSGSYGHFGKQGQTTNLCAALAGTCAGVTEAITVTPFQVIKVKMQAKEYIGKYTNSFDCFKQTYQSNGLKSLSIGVEATIWRNSVWNTVYFGLLYYIKDILPSLENKTQDIIATLVVGTFTGMIATLFNAPFDVVKSRVQAQITGPEKSPVFKGSTLRMLRQICQKEGLTAVYKGLTPKILRMGIGGGVCMATYESVIHLIS